MPINPLANMTLSNISIVFFGTPDFAIPSLDMLLKNGCDIKAVVTAPDKAAGRGLLLSPSPIKKYAVEKGLYTLQPDRLKNEDFIRELERLNPDMMVVIAFKKLPREVWSIPKLGTINIHPSLLPDYRGSAPLNWALINGEKETGISIIRINDTLDAGDILAQIKVDLSPDICFGKLHDQLKIMGAELLVQTIREVVENKERPIRQEHIASNKKAPKIKKEDCLVSFDKTADEAVNRIRGLSPYPTAYMFLKNKYTKIFRAHKEESPNGQDENPVGEISTDYKTFLKIKCADGYIYIDELQTEGKKRMRIEDFLQGWR